MMSDLADLIRVVPDFPQKGVLFRDISPLLAQKWPETIEAFAQLFKNEDIDAFAGIDSRGFLFASGLASHFGKNVVLVRKAGKLPPPVFRQEVKLEYGSATLEMAPGQGRIALVDDVLATGGTLNAAAALCTQAGYEVKTIAAFIDLKYLNDFEWRGMKAKSLFTFE